MGLQHPARDSRTDERCADCRTPEKTFSTSSNHEIVIVGPCASGKTTLVRELIEIGYRARVVAQEHSEIPHLWERTSPAFVIALEVDLETVRNRRGSQWPASVYDVQHRRLAAANGGADFVLDTTPLSPIGVLAAVTKALRAAGVATIGRSENEHHSSSK